MNASPPPTSRGRVLVVDAQRNTRATIGLLLRAEGYTVFEADTHDTALAGIARGVDLMLVRLKSMNALELIPRAVALAPYLRILVMTSFGAEKDAQEAVRCGACNDYMMLPFKERELRERVERLIKQVKP
ncbi:response regulator [Archangium gephyra]|uniref:response regulator n=1 Tax=Archangium gephyra TaxID=48 RepID=UPI0035D4C85F